MAEPRGTDPPEFKLRPRAHPDRGSQSASDHLHSELRRQRMGGVGQCADHAVVESPFVRVKVELVHHDRYATRDEAKASTVEVIEVFFIRIRRHRPWRT